MPDNHNPMPREAADTLALEVLTFIASDADRLHQFAAVTGVTGEHLRRRAGDAEVLAAALEMLLQDEASLLMFCANRTIAPEQVQRALYTITQRDEM